MPVIVAEGKTLNLGKVCFETKQEVIIPLCQEYNDIFSCTYEDLKGFEPSLFQHIESNENAKLVR